LLVSKHFTSMPTKLEVFCLVYGIYKVEKEKVIYKANV